MEGRSVFFVSHFVVTKTFMLKCFKLGPRLGHVLGVRIRHHEPICKSKKVKYSIVYEIYKIYYTYMEAEMHVKHSHFLYM